MLHFIFNFFYFYHKLYIPWWRGRCAPQRRGCGSVSPVCGGVQIVLLYNPILFDTVVPEIGKQYGLTKSIHDISQKVKLEGTGGTTMMRDEILASLEEAGRRSWKKILNGKRSNNPGSGLSEKSI